MAKKARIDKDGYVTFLNDKDGLSAKDYLLIISTGVFFLALTIGFISVLLGRPLGDEYFALLGAADAVVITVVGGIMGVQGVEVFANRNKDNAESTQEQTKEDDII